MNQVNPTQKATQLLLALDKKGADILTFEWALQTGRLAAMDYDIMMFVKAGNLAATNDALRDAYRYYFQSMKSASVEELTAKKWLSKSAMVLASKIAKTQWFQKVN